MWAAFKADPADQDLRNRLIERYRPLVVSQTWRVWRRLPNGVEFDDLCSAGVFGLMDAIDAFDPERGVKFEIFGLRRIHGAIIDELRKMDWVPRLTRSRASKINAAILALEIQLGRPPTIEDLAARLELSVGELEKLMQKAEALGLISLHKKWYETDGQEGVEELDLLEDRKGEDPTLRLRQADLLRLATRGLNRNERLLIVLYYYEGITMKQIGATLGLSESRVSQMHTDLIQRLRGQLAGREADFRF